MKTAHKGSIVPVLITIIVILIVILGIGFYKYQKDMVVPTISSNTEQSVQIQTQQQPVPSQQQALCTSTSPASLSVNSPIANTVYTPGQQVTITWTSCNVDKVFIGWAQGGHDKGFFEETPMLASQGSYQWTVPNYPGIAGDYWISVNQAVAKPNNNWTTGIFSKSGGFSIQ